MNDKFVIYSLYFADINVKVGFQAVYAYRESLFNSYVTYIYVDMLPKHLFYTTMIDVLKLMVEMNVTIICLIFTVLKIYLLKDLVNIFEIPMSIVKILMWSVWVAQRIWFWKSYRNYTLKMLILVSINMIIYQMTLVLGINKDRIILVTLLALKAHLAAHVQSRFRLKNGIVL